MTMFLKSVRTAFLVALFGVGTLGLVGCDDGRFENAGEEVDEAGEELQDSLEDRGEDVD
jgi:hypothetical protein